MKPVKKFCADDAREGDDGMEGFITLAAHDSADWAKEAADVVCGGRGDEILIREAVDGCVASGKNLYFFDGTYVFEGFKDFGDGGPLAAVVLPSIHREIQLIGQSLKYSKKGSGVNFYVPASALEGLPCEGVDLIRTAWTERGIGSGSALRMENIQISLSHNRSPVRCIDLRRCDRPELKNVKLVAYLDMNAGLGNPPDIACRGCIGLTMTDGSNNSFSSYTNVGASGFYEGIQVSGEHVVMTNCSTIMCFYGYTFGNYPIHCGANHPITMINCCDERNVNLPLFNDCGDDDGAGGRLHGMQEVTMIGFNVERIAEQSPGKVLGDLMREVRPGTWRGNIDFTAQPAWCHLNDESFQLWESDGSGSGFRTRNNCHKLVCTTEERLRYYPTLGQEVFDTDLGKRVICIDPSVPTWVDFNGNEA